MIETESDEARIELKKLFVKANYKAYTILRSVSKSGMFRRISVLLFIDNEPFFVDYLISRLGHYKRDTKNEGLRVSGCGMDMGFDVVYNTSRAVFIDEVENEKLIHRKDGGYVVSHRWL